jgi:gluconate 5-dehydrogenase
VNALAPGFFPSRMMRSSLDRWGIDRMCESIPLHRLGDDKDLRSAAVLFASDAGKHITGQVLAEDGGVTAA